MLIRVASLIGLVFMAPMMADRPAPDTAVTRILLGSCIQQDRPTPIFKTMLAAPADLLILLGDNIYADTEDMAVMRAKYQRLAANGDFAALRASMPLMATWDDHDYGVNDGGADFPMRDRSQTEFLDFLGVPEDSPRRKQQGVYNADILGPQGKRLQVICLDTRYFRSPLKQGDRRVGGPYYPDEDPGKTMLGNQQWRWLEKQLRLPADLRLIGTSIQCIAEAAGQETWSNLPRERQRLLDLIKTTQANGVILLSGDRHWSELSMLDQGVPYPIYDLTCSSLNQIHERGTPTVNRFRVSDTTYHHENFGVISIDWDADQPSVCLQIRDIEGDTRIEQTIPLDALRF